MSIFSGSQNSISLDLSSKNSVRTFGPSKLVRKMTRRYFIGLYNF